MAQEELVLIWSEEHFGWWKAAGWGYTRSIKEAGGFTRERAEEIVNAANYGGQFHECIVLMPQRPSQSQADVIEELLAKARDK